MQERIEQLARSFPSLQDAPGVSPWDPAKLDDWAASPVPGTAARCAVQFVLSVWNLSQTWRCGPFHVVNTFTIWDEDHRSAFLAWATDPWWM
jgi:hypothetical protein